MIGGIIGGIAALAVYVATALGMFGVVWWVARLVADGEPPPVRATVRCLVFRGRLMLHRGRP